MPYKEVKIEKGGAKAFAEALANDNDATLAMGKKLRAQNKANKPTEKKPAEKKPAKK